MTMSKQKESQNNRSLELCQRVVTTESFIAEAKEVYGDRYDYTKVEYKIKNIELLLFALYTEIS